MIVRTIPAVKIPRPVGDGCAEDRDPAEHELIAGSIVAPHQRGEDDDPPQSEHDARDRGDQLDQRPEHGCQAPRREQAEEEADGDADRHRRAASAITEVTAVP